MFYLNDDMSLYDYIIGIFNFSTLPFAWYIEMYIGLFLLIPFLNILYKNIKDRKQKQILIISLLFICSLPQTLRIFNISGHSIDILPSWWGSLYPILLYFVGCYIKEYNIKINKIINLFFIVSLVFIQSFVMYFYCQGNSLNQMLALDYNYLPSILLAILVFILLYDIQIKGTIIRNIFSYISKLTFGLYLFSYMYDKLVYNTIQFNLPIHINSFLGLVFYTPIIFILSLISSMLLDLIINLVSKCINIIKKKHNEKYEN
jgi:surface polysaccharide O-acyltransferase-like enzyme